MKQILSGTTWMDPRQLRSLAAGIHLDPAVAMGRLKSNQQMLRFTRDGRDIYPRYAFGEDIAPLPVMREIMATFQGWSPLRIAAWFESTSSYLQGQRPKELIIQNPALVVNAAKDAVLNLM